jgi:transcriptional regulator with XRE-family HTH domain
VGRPSLVDQPFFTPLAPEYHDAESPKIDLEIVGLTLYDATTQMRHHSATRPDARGRGASDRIPDLLRRLIQRSGLSQAEVARRIGMQPTHLNAFLKGRGDCHSRRVFDLLDELGLSVEEMLLQRLTEAQPESSKLSEFDTSRLCKGDRSAVVALIRRLSRRPSVPRPRLRGSRQEVS